MKNEFEKRGDHYAIFANGRGLRHEILIDETDFEVVATFPGTWYVYKHGHTYYAQIYVRDMDSKSIIALMHRVILNPPGDREVDHRNHDGLDNRRKNIRIATRGENGRNAKNNVERQSEVNGVSWHAKRNVWEVRFWVDGRYQYFASFQDQIVAEAVAFMYQETGKRIRWLNPRGLSDGVYWNAQCQAWRAQLWMNGKQVHLGCFDIWLEAHAAVCMFRETGMRVKCSRKRRHEEMTA